MNCRFCGKDMKPMTEIREPGKIVATYQCECGATIKQARLIK